MRSLRLGTGSNFCVIMLLAAGTKSQLSYYVLVDDEILDFRFYHCWQIERRNLNTGIIGSVH